MAKIPCLHPTARAWLLDGPLSPYVGAFSGVAGARPLCGKQAARPARRGALRALDVAVRLPAHSSTRPASISSCDYHLPRCDCPDPARAHPANCMRALVQLLALLRDQGVIWELPTPSGPIADELRRYDAHMRDARGLASARVAIACASLSGCC